VTILCKPYPFGWRACFILPSHHQWRFNIILGCRACFILPSHHGWRFNIILIKFLGIFLVPGPTKKRMTAKATITKLKTFKSTKRTSAPYKLIGRVDGNMIIAFVLVGVTCTILIKIHFNS